MKKYLFFLFLGLFLFAGTVFYFLRHTPSTPSPSLLFVQDSDLTHLEILWQNQRLELKKNATQWVSEPTEQIPSLPADEKFLKHFLDLLQGMSRTNPSTLSQFPETHAPQYGMGSPSLGLNFGNENFEESLIFGTQTPSQKKVWLYVPRQRTIYEVPSILHSYLTNQNIFSFLDLRLTDFSTDDIEEFISEGLCKPLHLFRDGDRWKVLKGNLHLSMIDEFLDQITELRGQGITAVPAKSPWCKLQFIGRNGRNSTYFIFGDMKSPMTLSRNKINIILAPLQLSLLR